MAAVLIDSLHVICGVGSSFLELGCLSGGLLRYAMFLMDFDLRAGVGESINTV